MKHCADCYHHNKQESVFEHDRRYQADRCYFFEGKSNPVREGKMTYIECEDMRLGPCGMDGKFFKPEFDDYVEQG